MGFEPHHSFPVADRSHLAAIKKDVRQLATDAGFSAAQVGKVDIIIAEITSNFIKHAGTGELLVRTTAAGCIDIFGIDNGPGIADLPRMLQDGQSSSNTLGGGLGAIRRLSDHCQIYTQKNWGTIVYARMSKRSATRPKTAPPFQIYSLLVPYPGEVVCGDGFMHRVIDDRQLIFLGDGLGHGPNAHHAVSTAIEALRATPEHDPVELLRIASDAVKKTRGLVGTVAVYDRQTQQWSMCGVGNIATRGIHGMGGKNLLPYNGIIGHTLPRTLHAQMLALPKSGHLILCSDGIRTRWELPMYTGIHRYDPCMLAAAIYKDFSRRNDDASVVVARML